MPRSTYIYIALVGELPIRAFTVKREMYEWLQKQDVEGLWRIKIYAMRDGDTESVLANLKRAKTVLDMMPPEMKIEAG
jgi:hypothetical protein